MGGDNTPYPPLTTRHKRIFAVSAVAAVVIAAAVAAGRMAVIQWWLVYCDMPSSQCHAARLAFEWWWLALLAPVFAIAALAHWLTRDRLTRTPGESSELP